MINYETLRKAHALCDKSKFYLEYSVEGDEVSDIEIWAVYDNGEAFIYVCDIDNLMDELEELTKPELEELTKPPKYKIGAEYWILINNEPKYGYIVSAAGDHAMISIEANSYDIDDFELHPSREALIESQIRHWTKLLAEDMNKLPGASCCSVHAGSDEECEQKEHKCTHESDSVEHIMTDARNAGSFIDD